LFIVVRRWERERIRSDFQRAADDRFSALRRGIELKVLLLESLRALYVGSHEVERHEFHEFVKPFLARLRGVQALEWIPRVPDAHRAAYERAARQDGFSGFQITQREAQGRMVRAAERQEYFPVYFVEPYEGNEVALGFDLASNPTRLAALTRSRDAGKMIATARITLVQETGDQFGFLIFLPVYRKGAPTDSTEARHENLEGFVLGVFCIGDILEHALTYLEPQGIDVQLYDRSPPQGERFLCFHPSRTRKAPPARIPDKEPEQSTGLHFAKTLALAGRAWLVVCTPTRDYIAARTTLQPIGALSFGLLFTGLLTAYFLVSIARTARVQRLAAIRSLSDRLHRELLTTLQERITELEKALEINDMTAIGLLGQRLESSCTEAGLDSLAHLAQNIESAARRGELQALPRLFLALRERHIKLEETRHGG